MPAAAVRVSAEHDVIPGWEPRRAADDNDGSYWAVRHADGQEVQSLLLETEFRSSRVVTDTV